MTMTPTLRVLSLGAGVQSTALAILAVRGDFQPLDAAIFADTGWEPTAVYTHLDRLEREVLTPGGVPLYRVTAGNIREDALDPGHKFASMPLYVLGPCQDCGGSGRIHRVRGDDGQFVPKALRDVKCTRCNGTGKASGMARRQCTSEYKLKPLHREVRRLLGAEPRENGVPGRVPKGVWAEQWIGISQDESHRALDSKSTQYARSRWPLLERKLSRSDCAAINVAAGFPDVAKSACIGCPYHGNRGWRDLRDNHPAEWADAVEFDAAIRDGAARANATGNALRGAMFLHRSRVPLEQAPINRITRQEAHDAQGDVLDLLSSESISEAWDDDAEIVGCGPHACRLPGDPLDDEEVIMS